MVIVKVKSLKLKAQSSKVKGERGGMFEFGRGIRRRSKPGGFPSSLVLRRDKMARQACGRRKNRSKEQGVVRFGSCVSEQAAKRNR